MTTTLDETTVADVLAAATGRLLTVADWVAVGETRQRWELVEGNPATAPSPIPEHQIVGALLFGVLRSALPPDLAIAPDVDLDLQLDPPDAPGTVREPDLVVVTRAELQRRRQDGGFLRASAALLVVEILSPGSLRTDRSVKRRDYADAGIPHYWIVELDPRPSLTAGRLENGSYADDGPETGTFRCSEPFAVEIDLDALV